ncbi:tyrosine phosphatase [Xylariomycetidae sp. FL2044]|nr:tyrosine phosphatase [Xylariomycetidae sp. FL2044]
MSLPIDIQGVPNFRDIGGYAVANAPERAVRRNVVFRSAEPSKITGAGIAELKKLGIVQVFHLRSERELAQKGPYETACEWHGADRVVTPVFRYSDYAPDAVAVRFQHHGATPRGFSEAFTAILRAAAHPDNAARPYARILRHLASEHPPSALLIHCEAGKDRTAVVCALILALCGVEDGTVAEEYSLTDIGLESRHQEFISKLLQNPAFQGGYDDARDMVLARKENMLAFLASVKDAHGSIEQCVVDLNLLDAAGIVQLRRNMIVSGEPNGQT